MFQDRRNRGVLAGIAFLASFAVLGFLAGCSDDEPTAVADQDPPAKVDDLTLQVFAPTSVWLRWSAPGDDGDSGTAASYDIRTGPAALTLSEWAQSAVVSGAPRPAAPQSPESLWVGGLEIGRTYHFAVRAVDEAGNLGPLSDDVSVSPSLPDTVRPAPVTDLRVTSVSDSSVTLAWTATGDDSLAGTATVVDLRYSPVPITDANWMTARSASPRPVPLPGGAAQMYVVTGLEADKLYYFGIKTADEAEQWSATSNIVPGRTMGGTLPQSSAANCLANLKTAYEKRNLEAYRALFATDFVFEFNPSDVQNPENPTPVSWGLADESASAGSMFASGQVDQIGLDFQAADPVPSDDEYPSSWRVEMTEADVQVYMTMEDGSPLLLRCQSGRETFYFRSYPGEQATDGRPVWRIFHWIDRGFGSSPFLVAQNTWGSIKATFH